MKRTNQNNSENKKAGIVEMAASYDMGWQKRRKNTTHQLGMVIGCDNW